MQNENLKCNATNCAYNQGHECIAGHIHVSGLGAVSVEGTTCTTFVDEKSTSLTNSLSGDPREKESFFNSSNHAFVNGAGNVTTKPSNIECEAHNCKYNKNKDCHAKSVLIDELNECCDTFDYADFI